MASEKNCLYCGTIFYQAQFQLDRAFVQQKYCSKKCGNRAHDFRLKGIRRQEKAVKLTLNADDKKRDRPRCSFEDDNYIPSGLLVPRPEPPDRIRAGVIKRMMQGATI